VDWELQLEDDELEAAYPGKHVSSEHMRNLVALYDLFCLSEVNIFRPSFPFLHFAACNFWVWTHDEVKVLVLGDTFWIIFIIVWNTISLWRGKSLSWACVRMLFLFQRREKIYKNQGPWVNAWMPRIFKWQAFVSRHLIVAYRQTQSLLASTKIQLKRCVPNGIIHRLSR
jgi:hypothetical protein